MLCSSNPNSKVLKLLIDHSSNINVTNENGNTPLTDLILNYPKEPNFIDDDYLSCVKLLLDAGASIYKANKFGDYPLKLAQKIGSQKLIDSLSES